MKLQEVRKKAGLSQSELAKQSGISVRTIQDYEYGRSVLDNAHIDRLVQLSDAMDVPFYELIDDDNRRNAIKANLKRGC